MESALWRRLPLLVLVVAEKASLIVRKLEGVKI